MPLALLKNKLKKLNLLCLKMKEIIQRMVHGEFAFYYNGYEGRYNIYLKDDTVVQKGTEIFADESQYLSILSNTESTEVASLNN